MYATKQMVTKPDLAELQEIPLFQGLTPAELGVVVRHLHRITVPSRTNLCTEEQPGEVAYIILSGAVKVFVQQPDGRQVILALLARGEVVGEMSMVDYLGRSASAVTIEPCELLWLDRTSLWECLKDVPALSFNLARLLSRRLRLADERIRALAVFDLPGRVAHQLLALAGTYGTPVQRGTLIPFRLTQTDLSDLVGGSRSKVNQALSDFREQGLIAMDHEGHITLLEPEALDRRCV